MKFSNISFLTIVIIASLAILSCGKPTIISPPNILFIMSDDHAQQAISAYGGHLVKTPNIDRIGQDGIIFSNSFVTNSICAPSRAVILTGKYSHMNGLRDNSSVFDTSQQTFIKQLTHSGYHTGIVGKWHLKNPPSGFDYWNILIGQGQYYNPTLVSMGDTSRKTGYTTDIITDLGIQFLNNRDSTKPFCLMLHHKAAHRNFMPDTKHLDLFEDREIPVPETFFDNYNSRSTAAAKQDMRIADMYLSMDMKLHPEDYDTDDNSGGMPDFNAEWQWQQTYERFTPDQKAAWDAYYNPRNAEFKALQLKGRDLEIWKYQRYIRDYLKCVVSIDENVGRILDYLKDQGLSENTIVVYTSDQGFYLGEHGWYDKRFMYEESFRTPLLLRYPAKIAKGQKLDHLVINADHAPTFLDFAGVAIPRDIQGQSLKPLLEGSETITWRDAVYYHYYQSGGWHTVPKHEGVRTHRYKLISFYELDDGWEFYDLEKDPKELNNVYANPVYAKQIGVLKEKLDSLRSELSVNHEL